MRQQILRFPVGQQFRKILEDDHEWIVLTDLHLKPLIMERGNIDRISHTQRSNTYLALSKKVDNKKITRVYDLHTHPAYDGIIDVLAPSQGDMSNFLFERGTQRFKGYGILVAGSGVITKKGILLVKIAEKLVKIEDNHESIPREYSNKVSTKLKDQNIKNTGYTNEFEQSKTIITAHKKAFKELSSETDGINAKTVGRNHRFTMRRRR